MMLIVRRQWRWLVLATLVLISCNLARGASTPTPPPFVPPPTLEPVDALQPVTTQEAANPDCVATPLGWVPYTVEPGDSMGLLAEQTSSTVQELVVGNCLDNADQIFVGQVLYVPRQPVITP